MKKILSTIACVGCLATTASADFARVEMGVGGWSQKPSGTISYTDNSSTGTYISSETADTSMYAWVLIKHPIPVLPNVRLEYVNIKDKGTSTGKFADFDTQGYGAPTTFDITQYDVIPYYNILDNTAWITLDLGLDLKIQETSYTAGAIANPISGAPALFDGYSDTTSTVIPMVYVRGRVEIPATNIGFETDVKYITYGKDTVYDIRAKVDYTLGFIPVVQPALELGYRMQKFDITSDDEKTKMNMDYAGFYAGLMLRF